MHIRVPTLRCHTTGVWFCQWGGRRHYFTKDKSASEDAFVENMQEWNAWREQMQKLQPRRRRGKRSYSVAELAKMFLEVKETDTEEATYNYFRHHLGRFVRIWGGAPGSVIDPIKLQAFKTDMKRATKKVDGKRVRSWSDRTVNHDLIAVKCLVQWATDMEYIAAVNFRAVKQIGMPMPPDKSMKIEAVRAMIALARDGDTHKPELEKDPRLEPWMMLNYLALLRPSEVVRLVARKGRFIEHGIFVLDYSKTMDATGTPRHIVLSDEALMWLEVARPHWSRLDSYGAAVVRACGPGGPHRLRHSAATHLGKLGAARADIEIILGHLPPRVSLIYNPIDWQPLRALAARLRV